MMAFPKQFREDRGQAIIMFVGIFTIAMVLGVLAVDVGLWLSERRGAQTDADLSALAGAQELMVLDAGQDEADAAEAFAEDFVVRNDESGNASLAGPVIVDDSCFSDHPQDRPGVPDSVTVDVRHDSRPLFGQFFELLAPDIGAHAKACAGSLRGTSGLRPLTLSMLCSPCFEWIDDGDGEKEAEDDMFIPRFGEDCIIRSDGITETESGVESSCDEESASQVGSIRLGREDWADCGEGGSGANDYKDNLIEGSPAWCEIDDIIDTEPGFNTGPTKAALEELLASEGECDAENCAGGTCDGIDQFAESFSPADAEPSPDVVYSENNCTTPRAIDIVIIDQFDGTGMDHRPILGFAAFFILQCEVVDKDGNIEVYPKCDMGGGGHFQIRGRFMKILDLEGMGGPMDEFGTRVILLVE